MDERVCIVCGATFMPKTHQQKCCSSECSSRNANAKKEEYRRAKGERELAAIERVCTVCGATFHPNSYNQICCSKECIRENFLAKCREYRRRKYAEKKVQPKTEYIPYKNRKGVCDSYCKGCVFLGYATGDIKLCEYLLRTEKRRPCPAGTGCTVKQVGERKPAWVDEKDETWKAKLQRQKKLEPCKVVFHRVCPVCGTAFDTTDGKKIYCSSKCRDAMKVRKAKAKREAKDE
jgi:predicted nucleic acid-binding Zn ribbon protein